MLTIGIFSALGLLLLALKIGGRKTIGSDVFVDVLITADIDGRFLWYLQWYGCSYGWRSYCVYCFVYYEKDNDSQKITKKEPIKKKCWGKKLNQIGEK